ncbi:hypothetical protein SLA2020_453270 [Shorea laevis]
MGEWIIGAFINLFGSIAINFGTNLLKLGHNERERHSMLESDGTNGKLTLKPIIHFHTWRVGKGLYFLSGNCLNFISFGYAAQSLLAALGSIQFVSNIAFAYFVLNKMVTVKILVATAFIVLGNIFLVAFGNHQSPVYTPEQLLLPYITPSIGEENLCLLFLGKTLDRAVGSCSVLFAKSLSNLLRLAMYSGYQLHGWFTYSMLLLFLSTAGFWMTRLNEGLSLFDAILIVPMFQIAWTFFSICTGFIYFQEYQVLDALRTTMFILGMMSVFVGISLLAPDESKGGEVKDNSSLVSEVSSTEVDRLVEPSEEAHSKDARTFVQGMLMKTTDIIAKAKVVLLISLGFRGSGFDRAKILSMRNSGWSKISMDEDGEKMLDARPAFSDNL